MNTYTIFTLRYYCNFNSFQLSVGNVPLASEETNLDILFLSLKSSDLSHRDVGLVKKKVRVYVKQFGYYIAPIPPTNMYIYEYMHANTPHIRTDILVLKNNQFIIFDHNLKQFGSHVVHLGGAETWHICAQMSLLQNLLPEEKLFSL